MKLSHVQHFKGLIETRERLNRAISGVQSNDPLFDYGKAITLIRPEFRSELYDLIHQRLVDERLANTVELKAIGVEVDA